MKVSELREAKKSKEVTILDVRPTLAGKNEWMTDLHVDKEGLTSLEGSPRHVHGDFDVSENKIKSFAGGPVTIEGTLDVSYNQLTSLDDFPESIGDALVLVGNSIKSLKGIHEKILYIEGVLYLDDITREGLVDILKMQSPPRAISHPIPAVNQIIHQHLKMPFGKERVASAMIDFVEADLETFI